ncbi:hypothetical protein D3C85_374740 [compost metagenome]
MAQSKMQSLIETSSNTLLGVIGSWLITMGCLMLFTTPVGIATSSTIACTIWSLARGYCVRRYFSSKEN